MNLGLLKKNAFLVDYVMILIICEIKILIRLKTQDTFKVEILVVIGFRFKKYTMLINDG
jgi:hypothetical protein